MKKLMFVAAAALCGSLFADVTSANIVGYQNKTIPALNSMSIPSFSPVGAETATDVTSLKITAADVAGGQIQIQTLTSGGATDRTLYWIPEAEAEGYGLETEGWYDSDEGCPAEKSFEEGEGFCFSNDYEGDASVTFSGEVASGATEFPLGPLNTACGNMTPVDCPIQGIVVTAEGVAGGQIQIQTLTSGGATDRTFYWIPEEEAEGYGLEGEGWYDSDEGTPADISFGPGEGFCVSNDYEGDATMTIPAAY